MSQVDGLEFVKHTLKLCMRGPKRTTVFVCMTYQLLLTLPPFYRTSLIILCSFRGSQRRPHRERSLGCCRRGECTLHFHRGCNLILPTGEYPQGCGSGWHPRPCAPSMQIQTCLGFYRHFQPFPLSVCGPLMLKKIHHCASHA